MNDNQTLDPMAAGLRALLPPGYAKTLGFLMPALEMTQELIDWYENEHSVYASFMWPHMRRYQRNYIMNVQRGPTPLYKVVSEFVWKGEEDKRKVAALYATDAAAKTTGEVLPPFIILPFPPGSYFLLPVEVTEVARGKRLFRHDEPHQRKVILLRCGDADTLTVFEAAAASYADKLARAYPDAAVTIDFRRERAEVPAPADAVLFIDVGPGESLPDPRSTAVEVVNIFDVITLRSPIKED